MSTGSFYCLLPSVSEANHRFLRRNFILLLLQLCFNHQFLVVAQQVTYRRQHYLASAWSYIVA
jgi:hypothetical protein